MQLVEGQRPDVQAINRFLIAPADILRLVKRDLGRRPIYIDSLTSDVLSVARARLAGPVYELQPRR
jgi:hypothetical protein